MLITKSIRIRPSKKDGIRICIMRRIKPEFKFDVWIPSLSPSTVLLKNYHEGKTKWSDFEKRFEKEVVKKQVRYLKLLLYLAKDENISLLCWERKGENCHRILIAQKLCEMNPNLKIRHL